MKSLRSRLLARLLVGGTMLLGGAGTILHWELRKALTADFDASLTSNVQSLAALTERDGEKAMLEYTGEDLPQFARKSGPEVYLLRRPDGVELDRSVSLGDGALPLKSGPAGVPAFFDARLPDGRSLRCAGIRFLPHSEDEEGKQTKMHAPPGSQAVLVFGRDRTSLDRGLAHLRAGLLLVGGGALMVFAWITWWSVRNALKPVDRLGEDLRGVNAATLNTRFPVESVPSELQPVIQRLNELLVRLEGAFGRERRFTATAAHELRTPLAELRSLAEVNLNIPANEDERIESWRDILSATGRMESLAAGLLELARAEEPRQVLRPETVRIADAITDAWEPWVIRAEERGVSMILAADPGVTVETDPRFLSIILGNLFGNAAEHAPGGTTVTINASAGQATATLRVSNQAGDLREVDLPHLFERFWRRDEARSNIAHHGLGLALAAEFAEVLGGKLSPSLSGAGCFEMALELPRTSRFRGPAALPPDPAASASPIRSTAPARPQSIQ